MAKKLAEDATDETTEELEDKKTVADSAEDKSTGDSSQDEQTDDKSSDENWEKRFKGLQPKHQTLVEEHKELKVQIALDKEEQDKARVTLGLEMDELKSDVTKFTDSSEGLTKSNDELQKTVESLETQLERNKLIMSEYPDLAVLEAKGLIREDLDGDELTKALDDMRSLMVAKGESMTKDLVIGSSDGEQVTGQRSQVKGVSSISDALMVAQKEKNVDEINRLTALLVSAAETEIFQQK